jgi:cysteine desulfuration protein SufE
MTTIQEIEQEIIEEFEIYDDWMDKYEFLISYGKDLAPMSEALKTEDKLIKGCQSKVWLHADYDGEKMNYQADADAIVTKGIIGLLVRVLNHQSPSEIAKSELAFIDSIGLKEHLSPTRSNGLLSMVKQMKLSALQALSR